MKAAIDIGTNTVLLLIAEAGDQGLDVIKEDQQVPRLGKGVDQSGHISAEAAQRVIDALKEFKHMVANEYARTDDILVTATSAVRDARNQTDFLQQVKGATGLHVRVLSGYEEAHLTFLGALSMLDKQSGSEDHLVLDIGGGSTELAFGRRSQLLDRHSFDMGCVRFTERFLGDGKPSDQTVEACRNAIRQMLDSYEIEITGRTSLIGVAGTATSLAFIDKELQTYESSVLAGHRISKEKVTTYIRRFRKLSPSQLLEKYPAVMEGRADIFMAGLLILEQVMDRYDFDQLTISTGGIRHGVIIDS